MLNERIVHLNFGLSVSAADMDDGNIETLVTTLLPRRCFWCGLNIQIEQNEPIAGLKV